MSTTDWLPDILGDGFESKHISMGVDYSGPVRCTIIRKIAKPSNGMAIIYIHGYSDYFFQAEMADMFVEHGYSFYAVDLRKYGRSLMPGQQMFQVRDLHEYFSDIDACVDAVTSDGMASAVLLGHSTGGLTASLYMSESPSRMIVGLMLNSPFLDWNLPAWMKKWVLPVVSAVGRVAAGVHVRQKPDDRYARSLSRELDGEWDYRRDWKPDVLPDPDAGWIRAIQTAQSRLRHGNVRVPVLLMFSARSARRDDGPDIYNAADAILDVGSIERCGRMLGKSVTEVAFDGGLHDLVLSRPDVRNEVYRVMLRWLKELQSYRETASHQ